MSSYNIKISDASKDGEIVKFTVQTKLNTNDEDNEKIVLRQYEDFVFLLHGLITCNDTTGIVIPPLPPKPLITLSTSESMLKMKPGTVTNLMSGDVYEKDCKRLQRFIQDIADHHTFKQDEALHTFLTVEEAPVRAAVKKGMFNSFADLVDSARFHAYKDSDADFQKKRDNVNSLLLLCKQSHRINEKCMASTKALLGQVSTFSMAARNSATFDVHHNKQLVGYVGKFADILDNTVGSDMEDRKITDESIGSTLELYSRCLTACQEALFRRTCKLVEADNATKALDKAKPKNREQLLTAKEEAVASLDKISDILKEEAERFHEERVIRFRDSLVTLAQEKVANHKAACEMLTSAIQDLKG